MNLLLLTSAAAALAQQKAALIAQMDDVISPEKIGWWPPAPGWWVLAALVLASIYFLGRSVWLWYWSHAYRRAAHDALAHLEQDPSLKTAKRAQALIELLKRTFFTAYPSVRHQYAGSHGEQWLELMQLTCKKQHCRQLGEDDITTLLYHAKAPDQEQRLEKLFAFAKHWIKHHQREPKVCWQVTTPTEHKAQVAPKAGGAHV